MMPLTKYRKGFVLSMTLIFFFIVANLAFAETKTFVKGYSYQASEYDSKVSCRALALEQVKRLLLEELGTYLESDTEVKNFQLTKDQIITLTAGIVRSEIIEESWDGKTYYLKAEIVADPKDVASSIENLRQDRQKTKELEETRKKADEALREVERLRKELEIAKAGLKEQDRYQRAINVLSAIDWIDRGYASGIAGRHREEIEALTKAIELDPINSVAYLSRGGAHIHLKEYWQAIEDLDRAIALHPNNPGYGLRAIAYDRLGNLRQAIKDLGRAIELDPKDSVAYGWRGNLYLQLEEYSQAIKDFDSAIRLDMNAAEFYAYRGSAYDSLGNYSKAIRDSDKAIELNPKFADAYTFRGLHYSELGNYVQAIENYDKAMNLTHLRCGL